MQKLYYLILATLLISCSGKKKQDETIHIYILRGPSAIAFAEFLNGTVAINGKTTGVHLVDSPEMMLSLLVREEADIAVIPMITAANLYNKNLPYRLAGCPVWGTLYIIEDINITPQDKDIYLFGSGTTPDILTRYYLETNDLHYTYNYSYASVGEVMYAIKAGKVKRAVLAEPFVSHILESLPDFRITANLNQTNHSTTGFPQTAVLINSSIMQDRDSIDLLLERSARFANTEKQKTIEILEANQIFPEGLLSGESIMRSRINYIPAGKTEEAIYSFFEIIYQYEPKAIGGKIPDSGFIGGGL